MTVLEAVVLGAIQGATEFLPISSSAHLLLVPWLLGWPEHSLTFDVALHMGTLLAILAYFGPEIVGLARAAFTDRLRTREGRLAWSVVAGTVPAALAGLLLGDFIEAHLRSPLVPAFTLTLLGLALWYVDRGARKAKDAGSATFADVLYVGIAQALALVPGVSRSGVTITAGLMRGLDRTAAARISFLLSAPVIAGAGALELRHVSAADLDAAFWLGIATSAVVGYLVIRFMLDYLRRGTYAIFAAYRVLLAAAVVVAYALGLREL